MSPPSTQVTVLPGVDSYAPQIVVKVDGEDIPLDDVIELRVTLQKDELGGFTMLVANNFDLKTQKFRHSDDRALDVYKPVEIFMGYAGANRMASMFVGEITALQPSFPSSGLPTLNVTGTDLLARLRRSKPDDKKSKAYSKLRDWQIAEQIAQRHKLKLAEGSTREGPENTIVMQRDMDDLQFLLWLAKRNDFEAAIVIENHKAALYFGKPRDKRGPEAIKQVNLTWGESLVSFTPRLSIGSQVSKVTVRAWDSRTKQKIEYTATFADLKAKGNGKSGAQILEEKEDAKTERIVDRAVQSQEEAKQLAIQLLAETANQFLTGSGEAMGEPAIRPLTIVKLGGLGSRYNGEYYVSKCDHVYGASGYSTTFDVERMREGA
jgi:phage protein D